MRFWRHKKAIVKKLIKPTPSKTDVLDGMKICCAYFETNSQNYPSFEPEFNTSKIINTILDTNQTLTEEDVKHIVTLIGDIDQTEHYDGCGWIDYKMQLGHFLRLSGFEVKLFE